MPDRPELRECPSCGEEVGKYSLSCPKCGTNWQVRFFWKYYVPILGVCILLGLIVVIAQNCDIARSTPKPPASDPSDQEQEKSGKRDEKEPLLEEIRFVHIQCPSCDSVSGKETPENPLFHMQCGNCGHRYDER